VSIRLRLALWYGTLTALVVLVVATVTYAAHTRGHYDDLDRLLVGVARHAAEEYEGHGLAAAAIVSPPPSPGIVLRLVGPDGRAVVASPSADAAPPVDVARGPDGAPAFDAVAALSPPLMAAEPGPGTLGVVHAGDGQRWRVYVLPVAAAQERLVALAPLGGIDASIGGFRRLVGALVAVGALAALGAGYALASRALRPVAALTETAGRIARSRDFGHRVPVATRHDELGRLGATFNGMLSILEEAYDAQRRFVSDASHELRAPLTAIQANLELLERYPGMTAEERAEAVDEAGREARRLARLVGDLLALARADAGVALRRERVALDAVVRDVFDQARHLARGQRLELAGVEPMTVVGDRDRLQQLLLVLLDNALKYTPVEGEVRLALRRDGTTAEAVVADTGIGIGSDDLPRVFERFYRADPARGRDTGGTGLGLPIARWIAEQHGGEVRLESAPGRGTTATVRLPVLTAAARAQDALRRGSGRAQLGARDWTRGDDDGDGAEDDRADHYPAARRRLRQRQRGAGRAGAGGRAGRAPGVRQRGDGDGVRRVRPRRDRPRAAGGRAGPGWPGRARWAPARRAAGRRPGGAAGAALGGAALGGGTRGRRRRTVLRPAPAADAPGGRPVHRGVARRAAGRRPRRGALAPSGLRGAGRLRGRDRCPDGLPGLGGPAAARALRRGRERARRPGLGRSDGGGERRDRVRLPVAAARPGAALGHRGRPVRGAPVVADRRANGAPRPGRPLLLAPPRGGRDHEHPQPRRSPPGAPLSPTDASS
jgi:signal transduction histidine kinase